MKKAKIIFPLLFLIFSSSLFAQNFFTFGGAIDLSFNCDEEVIKEVGYFFPKTGLHCGFHFFNDNSKIGFYADGEAVLSYQEDCFCLGLSSLIGPTFLLETGDESGFLISPGLSAGAVLGYFSSEKPKAEGTLGQLFLGIGNKITYFFESGFSLGLNLAYHPLMNIYRSETKQDITKKFNKIENSFSVGIFIGMTDWF